MCRLNCAHFVPTPHSAMSQRQLEIDHGAVVIPRKLANDVTTRGFPSCVSSYLRRVISALLLASHKSPPDYMGEAWVLKLSWGKIKDHPALGREAVKWAQLWPFPTYPKHIHTVLICFTYGECQPDFSGRAPQPKTVIPT